VVLLCVDDDPDDVELFKDAVKIINHNWTCVAAFNGDEALKMLRTFTPDYIFLDINMPVMDGKETLRNLRIDRRLKTVPIHILSTSDSKAEIEICRVLGATSFLVKPNSFEGLVSSLRTVFERGYTGTSGGQSIL
jgi:CheY-like chemotaxis protein